MENKKLGQEPAFGCIEEIQGNYGEMYWHTTPSMSKRFYAACAAMQGLLANSDMLILAANKGDNANVDWKVVVIDNAYSIADELLKQENDGN